MATGNYYQNI